MKGDSVRRRRPEEGSSSTSSTSDLLTKEKETTASSPTPKKSIFRSRICLHVVVSLVALFAMTILPLMFSADVIKPQPLILPPRPMLRGALASNNRLTEATKLLDGKGILGPESIVAYNGSIYTGLHKGTIVKIDEDKNVVEFARLGPKDCRSVPACGRPLGMRLSLSGDALIVADAYLGVFRISLSNSSDITRIFPFDYNFKVQFFDDLVLIDENTILLTEASIERAYHESTLAFLESKPTGRIYLIDLKEKKYEILAEHLDFPNGIEQSTGEPDSVLFAETYQCRLRRLYFRGERKGQIVPLTADNPAIVALLPGFPDNIRRSIKYPKHYWVALAISRHGEQSSFSDWLMASPFFKRLLTRAFSSPILHLLAVSNYGIIVRIDETGRIIESLHDPTGNIPSVTEVAEVDDHLYLGNYFLPFLAKLKL